MRRSTFAAVQMQKRLRMVLAMREVQEMRWELCMHGSTETDISNWEDTVLRDYIWAPGGTGVEGIQCGTSFGDFEECVKKINDIFVGTMISVCVKSDTSPRQPIRQDSDTGSGWLYTSMENTVGAPHSLAGEGGWAANILHVLDFPKAPEGCILPQNIILRVPGAVGDVRVESSRDRDNADDLLDDALDSSFSSWQRMADDSLLYADDGDHDSLSLGDLCPVQRKVNLGRYRSSPAIVPLLYKKIATNFTPSTSASALNE